MYWIIYGYVVIKSIHSVVGRISRHGSAASTRALDMFLAVRNFEVIELVLDIRVINWTKNVRLTVHRSYQQNTERKTLLTIVCSCLTIPTLAMPPLDLT